MPESLKPAATPSQPYAPDSAEEAIQAYDLGAQLMRGLQELADLTDEEVDQMLAEMEQGKTTG